MKVETRLLSGDREMEELVLWAFCSGAWVLLAGVGGEERGNSRFERGIGRGQSCGLDGNHRIEIPRG